MQSASVMRAEEHQHQNDPIVLFKQFRLRVSACDPPPVYEHHNNAYSPKHPFLNPA